VCVCISECDQVQQLLCTPIVSRQKRPDLKKCITRTKGGVLCVKPGLVNYFLN
jgi:hypothetical protein